MSVSAPPAPRLRLTTKVSYGLGSVAQAVAGVALSTGIINFYLVRVLGLRPAVGGVVILASLVVDAVLDPAIGRFSDTFRSPWGRRHPFMYASAAPIGIAIYLLWSQPPGLSHDAMAGYVLFWLIALRLCSGLYQIPSDALTPELAPDYHERTSLISFRYFFGIFGGVGMTVLLLNVLLRKDASHPLGMLNRACYAEFGLIASITVFIAILVSSAATHRYIPYLQKPPRRSQSLRQTAREVGVTLSHPAMVVVMRSRSARRSAQVAVPVRLMRARVWREEMPTGPSEKPLGKPARSMSQAAGSFSSPVGTGPLLAKRALGSRKTTGSLARRADFMRPLASAGLEGMTTMRPGR